MGEVVAVERVKWYTLARKFPQLIGRTPDGARIPGGPYTVTQAVGGMVVLATGYYSMGLWAAFGTFGNYAVLILVTGGVVIGLGKIPLGARSPASIAFGAARAVSAPRGGRLRGKAVRIRAPHQVRHRTVVCRLLTEGPLTEGPLSGAVEGELDLVDLAQVVTAGATTGAQSWPTPPTSSTPTSSTSTPTSPDTTQEPSPPAVATPVGRRRPPRTAQSSPQLTGVQALMASVGTTTPKDD